MLLSLAEGTHLRKSACFDIEILAGSILLMLFMKLLLHVNCGALFFLLSFIHAVRNFFAKVFV